MKRISVVVFIFISAVSIGRGAAAAEGHSHASATNVFRINGAEVSLSLQPENYQQGITPKVMVMLKDPLSGGPVYEAELYILLEKPGSENHEAHQMASPPGKGNIGAELDFGGTMDMTQPPATTDLAHLSTRAR